MKFVIARGDTGIEAYLENKRLLEMLALSRLELPAIINVDDCSSSDYYESTMMSIIKHLRVCMERKSVKIERLSVRGADIKGIRGDLGNTLSIRESFGLPPQSVNYLTSPHV